MNKRNQRTISLKQKIISIISSLFLCIVLLEIGLRIGGFIFLSLQEHRNIISIRQKGTYRIMCLGESTTFGRSETSYPRQLEGILNQRNIGMRFSVINKGVPGVDSRTIVSQLEDNLNKYKPDMVTTMMGINDTRVVMAYEDIPVKKTTLLLKSLRTYKLVKLLKLYIINKARGIVIYKLAEKEENIFAGTDGSTQSNNIEQQEEIFKKAIEIDPRDDEAYIELAGWYLCQGKFDKAEELFNKAIEINPASDVAYTRLRWHYRSQGRDDKIMELFKKALEVNPGNRMAYDALGWCYRKQGRNQKAIELFKQAIQVDPENVRAYASLASCYEELGMLELAEEYSRKLNQLRLAYYNSITRDNYQKLKQILSQRGVRFVCVQYPVRSIEPLKRMFEDKEDIIFVDNEGVFRKALKQASYDEYFTDMFGGDFGHCTPKGNRLLAENIANVILKECFGIKQ